MLAAVIIPAYLFVVLFLPVPIDHSSIPTLVNGVTTSMSIVVGLGAAVIGIVFRADIEKGDYETRKTFFAALGLFIIALIYPFGSYMSLANNGFEFALRYSLGGYLIAILGIVTVYVLTAKKWESEKEEKAEKIELQKDETEQEKLKREFQHREL